MSYTIPSAFTSKLSSGNWLPCYLWTIIPEDVTVSPVRFCDNSTTLQVDIDDGNGAQIYSPSILTNLSEIQSRLGSEINTHDVEGASLYISAAGIDRDDILGAKMDGATVTIAVCDRAVPSDGAIIRFRGWVHDAEYADGFWKIQVVSLLKKLETEPFTTIAPECKYNLGEVGSPGCNVKGILTNPDTWQSSTAYTAQTGRDRGTESLVKPSTPNGFYYYPSVSGTSDTTEPTWPTSSGGTVVDGTVTWTAIPATRISGSVTAISSEFERSFEIDVDSVDNYFSHGKIAFTSGRNNGKTYPVLNYVNSSGTYTVTLIYQPFLPIEVGDTFTIIRGCSKAFFDTDNGCQAFRNQLNFPGFQFVPGTKIRNIRGTRSSE